jgi:hypothetical protein
VLQALEVLRVRDRTRVQAVLVARGARADLLDVGVGLRLLTGDVALLGLGRDDLVAQRRQARVQLGELGDLRERALLVRQLVELGVERLDVEEAELGFGLGVQGRLPSLEVQDTVTGRACGTPRDP